MPDPRRPDPRRTATSGAAASSSDAEHDSLSSTPSDDPAPASETREIGGRDGPDPTRFGDWEKNGRCIDF